MRSSLEEGRLPRQREKEWLSLLQEEGIHFSTLFLALCGPASTFRGAFSQCPPSFWIRKHLHCSLHLGAEVDRWYSPRTSQRSPNWKRGRERLPTEGEDNNSRPLKKWDKRQMLRHCLWKKASYQIWHTYIACSSNSISNKCSNLVFIDQLCFWPGGRLLNWQSDQKLMFKRKLHKKPHICETESSKGH